MASSEETGRSAGLPKVAEEAANHDVNPFQACLYKFPLSIFILSFGAATGSAVWCWSALDIQKNLVIEPALYDRQNKYVQRSDVYRLATQGVATQHCNVVDNPVPVTEPALHSWEESRRLSRHSVDMPAEVERVQLRDGDFVYLRLDGIDGEAESQYFGVRKGANLDFQLALLGPDRTTYTKFKVESWPDQAVIKSNPEWRLRTQFSLRSAWAPKFYLSYNKGNSNVALIDPNAANADTVDFNFTLAFTDESDDAAGPMLSSSRVQLRGADVNTNNKVIGIDKIGQGRAWRIVPQGSAVPGSYNFVLEVERLVRSEAGSQLVLIWKKNPKGSPKEDLLQDKYLEVMADAEYKIWKFLNEGEDRDRCRLLYDHAYNHEPTVAHCEAPRSLLNYVFRNQEGHRALWEQGFSLCQRQTLNETETCQLAQAQVCETAYPQTWSRVQCMSPAYSGAGMRSATNATETPLLGGRERFILFGEIMEPSYIPEDGWFQDRKLKMEAQQLRDAVLPKNFSSSEEPESIRSIISVGQDEQTSSEFKDWATGALKEQLESVAKEVSDKTDDNVNLLYSDEGRGRPLYNYQKFDSMFSSVQIFWMELPLEIYGAAAACFVLLYTMLAMSSLFLPIIAWTISFSSFTVVVWGCRQVFDSPYVTLLELAAGAICMMYANSNMYMINAAFERADYQPELDAGGSDQGDMYRAKFVWAMRWSRFPTITSTICTLIFLALPVTIKIPTMRASTFTAIASLVLGQAMMFTAWTPVMLIRKHYLLPVGARIMWFLTCKCCPCCRRKEGDMMDQESSFRVSDWQFIKSRRASRFLYNNMNFMFDRFSTLFLLSWLFVVGFLLLFSYRPWLDGDGIQYLWWGVPSKQPDGVFTPGTGPLVEWQDTNADDYSNGDNYSVVNVVVGLMEKLDDTAVKYQEPDPACIGKPQFHPGGIEWDADFQRDMVKLCRELCNTVSTCPDHVGGCEENPSKDNIRGIYCLPLELEAYIDFKNGNSSSDSGVPIRYLEVVQEPDFLRWREDERRCLSGLETQLWSHSTGYETEGGKLSMLWVAALLENPDDEAKQETYESIVQAALAESKVKDKFFVTSQAWAWSSVTKELEMIHILFFWSPLLLFATGFFATGNVFLGLTSAATQLVNTIVVGAMTAFSTHGFLNFDDDEGYGVAEMFGLYHAAALAVYYNTQLVVEYQNARGTSRQEKARMAVTETGHNAIVNGVVPIIIGLSFMRNKSLALSLLGRSLFVGSVQVFFIVLTFHAVLLAKFGPERQFLDCYCCCCWRPVLRKLEAPRVVHEMVGSAVRTMSDHVNPWGDGMDGMGMRIS